MLSAVRILIMALFSAGSAVCAAETPDVRELLEKADVLYRSRNSASEIEMKVETPDWSRTLEMRFWTEGMDKTFIYIVSPRKDAGVATLRLGNEMWNYFPKINKVMKIPPSMMMGSWMGSDFTNDDLVKESTFLDDYKGELFEPEKADAGLYYVRLVPRDGTASVWASIELEMDRESLLPARQRYYDEKGRVMRVMEFSGVRSIGGRTLPCVMEMTPLSKPGHKTVITYKKAEFDGDLPEDTFTLRNLRKRR